MAERPFTPFVDPPGDVPAESPLVFTVRGDQVHLAEVEAVEPDELGDGHVYLGRLGGSDCWAVDVDGDDDPDVAAHAADGPARQRVGGRVAGGRSRRAARAVAAHAPVLRQLRRTDGVGAGGAGDALRGRVASWPSPASRPP